MNNKILSTSLVLSSLASGCLDLSQDVPPLHIPSVEFCWDFNDIRARLDDCLNQYCYTGIDSGLSDSGVSETCQSSFRAVVNQCSSIQEELFNCYKSPDYSLSDSFTDPNDLGLDAEIDNN